MKNIHSIVRCCMVAVIMVMAMGCAQGQNEHATLKKAKKLVAQQQYASAFATLEEFDPTNDRPAVLAMKADIVLHYFAQSINHQIFYLKDLKEGECLDSIRGNFVMGDVFAFDVDSLTRRLLAAHHGDQSLLATHAAYHQALLDDYDEDLWLTYLTDDCKTLLHQATKSADACIQLGYLSLYEDMSDSAAYYYRRAVKLQDTLWVAHYNLGIIEHLLGHDKKAITHLQRAWKGYREPSMKGDAARVMAIIYDESLNNPKKAEHYYRQALAEDSTEAINWAFLLNFLLRQSSAEADVFPVLQSAWHVAVHRDYMFEDISLILGSFVNNEKTSLAISFLESRCNDTKDDYDLGGCHLLLFYLFQLLEDNEEDIAHLRKAIEYFERDEAPEDFLDSLRETLKEAEENAF